MADKKDNIALSDVHNAKGIELADRGWLDEALAEFQKAIDLDPRSAHAHDNLATVYAEKKLFRQAVSEYLTAIELEPDSATAHHNLACFLVSSGPEMAEAQYREVMECDPEYPDIHLNLGLVYADQGKISEAAQEYQLAITQNPNDALARHELATIAMEQGDYTSSISLLKTVIRLEPENYEAYLDLGICFAKKGFYSEAEAVYEKAQQIRPNDLLLEYNFAALYALWGREKEAKMFLGQAFAKDANQVRAWTESSDLLSSFLADIAHIH